MPPLAFTDSIVLNGVVAAVLLAGAVYYFGAVRARPDPCTPLYRDVLYGSLYRGLQALSHSEVEDWQVPYDNVVELGVVVHL